MTVKMCQNVSASLHCLSTNSRQIAICNLWNETLTDYSFLSSYHYTKLFKKTTSNSLLNSHVYWDTLYHKFTIVNQRIILKDDIEFVTEFPCLLGHTHVYKILYWTFALRNNTQNCELWQLNPTTLSRNWPDKVEMVLAWIGYAPLEFPFPAPFFLPLNPVEARKISLEYF